MENMRDLILEAIIEELERQNDWNGLFLNHFDYDKEADDATLDGAFELKPLVNKLIDVVADKLMKDYNIDIDGRFTKGQDAS